MATLRFFAAARAAVGRDDIDLPDAPTVAAALDAVGELAADPERFVEVAARCSFLVDGVSTRDRATPLDGVAQVDVMPPFAGG